MSSIAMPQQDAAASTRLYRAVWRWHFYAGLLVLPFMITLSITGAMYVFRDEIDNWYHADLKRVQVQDSQRLAPSAQVASALDAVPGTALKYTDPTDPGTDPGDGGELPTFALAADDVTGLAATGAEGGATALGLAVILLAAGIALVGRRVARRR